ncbi:hypothetical protein NKH82_17345 [Mesorhizobium sp. M0915]|uniref:hypothetical protein n=1 Tax=Mesorhizobium sp. M0915 TaxID=2957027 RepID=UPI0033356E9D
MAEMKEGTPVSANIPREIVENLKQAYGSLRPVEGKTLKELVYEALHNDVECIDDLALKLNITERRLRITIGDLKRDGVLVLEGYNYQGKQHAIIAGRHRTLESLLVALSKAR